MAKDNILFFYVTFPNQSEAKKLIRKLLDMKLIACANLFPQMTSFYVWKKQLKQEKEVVVIFKTSSRFKNKFQSFIALNHPYSTPCIAAFKTHEINTVYKNWLLESLQTKQIKK